MNETEKLIEEQKKNLPPELVRAIKETAWEPVLQKIGRENNLNSEQIEGLEREVMLALYAFEPLENLIANITRELGITEETSQKIFDSVWLSIMDPINRKASGEETTSKLVPEIAPEIHPMIEKGEMVHDIPVTQNPAPQYEANAPIVGTNFVPTQTPPMPEPPKAEPKPVAPVAPKPQSPTALTQEDRRYPGGVDPYREPVN